MTIQAFLLSSRFLFFLIYSTTTAFTWAHTNILTYRTKASSTIFCSSLTPVYKPGLDCNLLSSENANEYKRRKQDDTRLLKFLSSLSSDHIIHAIYYHWLVYMQFDIFAFLCETPECHCAQCYARKPTFLHISLTKYMHEAKFSDVYRSNAIQNIRLFQSSECKFTVYI